MTPQALVPAVLAILIALAYYRRMRRLFGRQRVQPARMKFRIAFLLFVGALLALRGIANAQIAAAMGAGVLGGLALGWLGLRLTQFENTPQGRFYTPHGGIGVALSVMLIGRLAYRFVVIWPALQAAHGADENPLMSFQRSPLTAAMFALLIGYYVAHYAGVLIRSAGSRIAETPGS